MRPTSNVCFLRQKVAPLPYDAELEYLESTSAGGQYIDTGIPFDDNNIEVDFTGSFKKPVSGAEGYFGCVNNKIFVGTYLTMYGNSSSDYTTFRFANAYTSETSSPALIYQGGFCRVFMSKSKVQIWDSEGTLVKDADESGTITVALNNRNIYLYAWNVKGTTVESYAKNAKFKSFKIMKNGVVLRDMIPVRVGSEGMMYDKVTGTLFHNLGTGNFICGRDKGTLLYDSQIEYLETTSQGGQYIDTGLKLMKDMKFEYLFSLLRKGSNQTLFGSNSVTSTDSVIAYQTSRQANLALRFLDSITSGFYQAYGKGFIVLKMQNQYAGFYDTNGNLLSEQSFSDATTTPSNNNIYLFSGNNNGTAANPVIEFKFGYFKVKIGNLLVMNLIPVRVGTEGCLYDKVSETLFHNAGTGDFILGNDI